MKKTKKTICIMGYKGINMCGKTATVEIMPKVGICEKHARQAQANTLMENLEKEYKKLKKCKRLFDNDKGCNKIAVGSVMKGVFFCEKHMKSFNEKMKTIIDKDKLEKSTAK